MFSLRFCNELSSAATFREVVSVHNTKRCHQRRHLKALHFGEYNLFSVKLSKSIAGYSNQTEKAGKCLMNEKDSFVEKKFIFKDCRGG